MPQDAFHIRRSTAELSSLLTGGKINRISQVSKDELTFIIYTGKSAVKLIISANATNCRVCLSNTEKTPLPVAPNFCMLLRKHLQGAEILSIRQLGFERIVEITLLCTSDFSQSKRVLYCELMGKYSNVVLTENGIILGALKTSSLLDDTHRVLLAGAKYELPQPQDKLSHTDKAGLSVLFDNFLQNRADGYDVDALSKLLFENVAGLALPTCRQIAFRYLQTHDSLQNLPAFLLEFCENEPCLPCLIMQDGTPCDFFAFPVEHGVQTPSLCKAEDDYYTYKETSKDFADKKRKLQSLAQGLRKKTAKRLQDTADKLREAQKADEYRIKGELLTANLYAVKDGQRTVELVNWYDENGGTLQVALDPTISPSKNAQRYFKTYNKLKRAKEVLSPRLRADEEELSYVDSVLSSIALAERADDLTEIREELVLLGLIKTDEKKAKKQKKETPVPFRRYEFMGYTVLVGRNNVQNDRLLKEVSANDIWLHVQKYHSSHVVIINKGGQVRDEIIKFACEICAYYSQGQKGDKIPVDYCPRKFVKKPNRSKAGFVVYTDYKTALAKPCAHEEYRVD
ncbi:MAG: NFACT family protein [Clostridia bacterium]|nr:NFACT family protein [Clostridia bacterium]